MWLQTAEKVFVERIERARRQTEAQCILQRLQVVKYHASKRYFKDSKRNIPLISPCVPEVQRLVVGLSSGRWDDKHCRGMLQGRSDGTPQDAPLPNPAFIAAASVSVWLRIWLFLVCLFVQNGTPLLFLPDRLLTIRLLTIRLLTIRPH